MLKLASAISLLGFFKSNLSIKSYLNLFWFVSFTISTVHKESFHFYKFYTCHIDLIKLLYTVLVNTFDLYNEYNICLASFFNLIELLPASV